MLARSLAPLPGNLRMGSKITKREVPVKNRLYMRSNILGLLTIGLAITIIAFILGISCQTSVPPTPAVELLTPAVELLTPAVDLLTPTPGLSDAPATGTPPSTPLVVEVAIEAFSFAPDMFIVPVGTAVTWYNNDSAPHSVTTREPLFDSDRLSKYETFSYSFNQSGTFEYYCTFHPYMKGKVIVE